MADALIVEVRDHRGRVLSRHPVASAQIRVGRAFDNDVVLDDPHADAHHAVLDLMADGSSLRVSDLGSVNGTRLGRRGASAEGDLWPLGSPIEVGRTTLTLFATNAPLAPAVPLQSPLIRTVTASRPRALALIGGAAVWVFLSLFLADFSDEGWLYWVGGALGVVLLLVGSKLASRPPAFTAHLGWVSAFTLVALLTGLVTSYAVFLFPSSLVVRALTWVVTTWLLASLLFFGHLELVSRRSTRFKLIASGVGVAALVGLGALATNAIEDHTAAVSGSLGTLRRVPIGLVPSSSLEEFEASLEGMKGALDEDALEITLD
jgi:hypothetical protein